MGGDGLRLFLRFPADLPVHSRTFPITVEVRSFAQVDACWRVLPPGPMAHNYANSMNAAGETARRSFSWGGTHGATALCGLMATAMLLSCGRFGLALEPSTPLANYGRQAWVMENGLPQNTVQALVQTRDGFVWLGTEVGLVRFDGNGFQVFDRNSSPALPGSDIRCLLETKDGALWIGTSEGLARWKDGVVTAFTTKDGLPGNGVLDLWEIGDSGLGLWTDHGIARQSGERFVAVRNVDAWPRTAIPISGEPAEYV